MASRVLLRRALTAQLIRQSSIRFYATTAATPQKKNKRWLNKFFSPVWEETKDSTTEWDQAARQLKESLVKKGDNQNIKALINKLIDVSPNGIIPVNFITMVEMAYSMVEMTVPEMDRLYKALARNNPIDIVNCSTVTKLYAGLYDHGDFYNGVLYLKFLRAQGKNTESVKLLKALLKKATDEDVRVCLKESKDLLDDELIALLMAQDLSIETYHEAINAKSELALQRKKQHGGDPSLLDVIDVDFIKDKATTETVIILLDSCLTLNDRKMGQLVLKSIVEPRFESLQPQTTAAALQFYELLLSSVSLMGGTKEFGKKLHQLIQQVPEEELVKESWDVLSQWFAYNGSSKNELVNLIEQMNKLGDSYVYHADETTLSGILKAAAYSNRDNQYIRDVIDFFKTIHIDCNVEGFSLLIQRSIDFDGNGYRDGDIGTAEKLFQKSLDEGCDWTGSVQVLENLLIKMCQTPSVDLADAFKLYRRMKMFTKTVNYPAQVAMLQRFVDGDFIGDAAKFLEEEFGESKTDSTSDIPVYQVPDIYKLIMKYIMRSNDYADSWYIFGILNRFFVLPYEAYQPVMWRFCQLQRPDAALKVFRSLREKHKTEGLPPPSKEIYIMLFNEFGRTLYEEGVLELHLYFKMDLAIEAEMPIINSIMSAYCDLQDNDRVLQMWSQVAAFPVDSGADNDTATIMIRHLTRSSIEKVEHFWQESMPEFNLTPSSDNLKQYVIANCYHGYYMRALNIVKDMENVYGIAPNEDIIKSLYNWTMIARRKENVEQWAIENHPEMWNMLKSGDELRTYLLPEDNDGSSDEMRRAQAINELEGEVREKNVYVAELPTKQ